MTIDTRAALIERIVDAWSSLRSKGLAQWHATDVEALAPLLGTTPGRFRRWLSASPDLRAALVAEGLVVT